MTLSVFEPCAVCRGCGVLDFRPCRACDGVGRVYTLGGPSYGCRIQLAERLVGEIVELGSGDRVKIAWFEPRPQKKKAPVLAFVAELDAFDDHEHDNPVSLPACVGVRRVLSSRMAGDDNDEHGADLLDPVLRTSSAGRQGPLL